jgi:hypothetical protein
LIERPVRALTKELAGLDEHDTQGFCTKESNTMNTFQEKVALAPGGTSGVALAAGFGNEAPMVGDRGRESSSLNRDHFEENSAELLRQGAVIENFFRENW